VVTQHICLGSLCHRLRWAPSWLFTCTSRGIEAASDRRRERERCPRPDGIMQVILFQTQYATLWVAIVIPQILERLRQALPKNGSAIVLQGHPHRKGP
jgi:hypothetical protein